MENLKFNIFNIISILIIYQGLAFALMLIRSQKPKHLFNYILAIFTSLIAINFLNIIILKSGLINFKLYFWMAYGLAYGPLFYLYGQSLIERSNNLDINKILKHLFPSIIAVFLIISSLFFSKRYLFYNNWVNLLIVIHLSYYLSKTLLLVKSFEKSIKNVYSEIGRMSLKWLNNLIYWMGALVLLLLISFIIPYRASDLYGKTINLLIYLTALFLINSMYYKGLKQPEVFGFLMLNHQNGNSSKEKYQSSLLTKKEIDNYLQKVLLFMKEEKPYLNSNITINQLSDKLNISTRYLSQIINDKLNQNFFDFINTYRVEEAKTLLQKKDNPRDRILEVMVDSGFSSKSTFNHVFKKSTGLTPSDFRKKEKKEV